ncbi:carboxymuconolactone decarboxylase family protein [Yinghuangia seranimata]|uniref:carboxymuconolactone decarboxylase family protein n=1 Tax=Yinghuangia seranimata TaxID=408067 RepID=UPI00248AE239|nr:carboxymuconolactone decarboxylase family protein [Yinghuangia seranimata]MDI2127216.1 carboxymuconolactone decarboxylase family protein [Yinghuangia seranimata]
MARIEIPEDEGLEVFRALDLAPHFKELVVAYETAVAKSPLDRRLHELVRMRIAQINACTVCLNWRNADWGVTEEDLAAVGEYADSPLFSAEEKTALEYATRFATDSAGIEDELLERLVGFLGPEGVVDLTLVLGKYLAMGRFMQVLGLDQACSLTYADGELVMRS